MPRFPALALALSLLVLAPVSAQIHSLTLLGRFDTGLGAGAAEITAFDATTARLFVTNAENNSLDIVNLVNPAAPTLLLSIDLDPFGDGVNSVATSHGRVAVAVEADPKQDPGQIVFFDVFGNLLGTVQAGALPDMVTFTPDGNHVLVANEGEPNDDYTVDPEGSVTLIDLSNGVNAASTTEIHFRDFNAGGSRAAELPAEVRIFGPGATVAQDLEPEYIAVSADSSTAWVSLQENNALSMLDLGSASVTSIVALGFKDHSDPANPLDASNRDGGIHIQNWPVWGMVQPDSIAAFTVNGTKYVITANEGDSRDYDGFSEEERMADLTLDPTAFPDAATLQLEENLGRLKTTSTLGDTDGDGDFDRLFAYGGRSFSIWHGADGSLVFDSGDDFEQITADRVPTIFNSDGSDPDEFDDRSDDKGPEPEAITVGRIAGRLYAFIGLERVGGLLVYDITDPAAPIFQLYEPGAAGDLAPEGLVFVDSSTSPIGVPLLVVSNEDSGTATIYSVDPANATTCQPGTFTLCLRKGRFQVQADWSTEDDAGPARAEVLNQETGLFYFFGDSNVELVVKVLDACNDPFHHFWVFAAGLTNLEVGLTVTDTLSGEVRTYSNDLGSPFEPIQDTRAFATCP
jgi:DNA-binding beta-propeller fold protein YncE